MQTDFLYTCVFCRTDQLSPLLGHGHQAIFLIIETLLECPICLSECTDPRVLPCLHSLCRKCLQEHIKTSSEGNNFKCPSCRHDCEVPLGGVTALPKNFLFKSLKEMLQQQSEHGDTSQRVKYCRVSCSRETMFFCEQGQCWTLESHSVLCWMRQLVVFQLPNSS